MIIDGVTIPDIPEELLAYPYLVIFRVYVNLDAPETRYLLAASTSPFAHIRKELLQENTSMTVEFGMVLSEGTGTSRITLNPFNKWAKFVDYDEPREAVFPVYDGATPSGETEYTLIWANSIVYEVATFNAETGAYTVGGIYFPKEKYDLVSISYDLFDEITRFVQKISGTTSQMNAIQVRDKLEEIASGISSGGTSGVSVVDVTLTEV